MWTTKKVEICTLHKIKNKCGPNISSDMYFVKKLAKREDGQKRMGGGQVREWWLENERRGLELLLSILLQCRGGECRRRRRCGNVHRPAVETSSSSLACSHCGFR